MDCKTARLLSDFARPQDLGRADAAAFEGHIADCPECAAVVGAERRLDQRLGEAMRHVPVPEGLRGRLLDRLAAERRGWYRRRLPHLFPVLFRGCWSGLHRICLLRQDLGTHKGICLPTGHPPAKLVRVHGSK